MDNVVPAFDSDRLQLPHLQLCIDVGSFVKVNNDTVAQILQFKEKEVMEKSVLIWVFDIVNKVKFEVSAKHNTPHWVDANTINSLAFVLFGGELNKFTWIGRGDTFMSNNQAENDNNNYNFPCDLSSFTLYQSVAKLVWIDLDRVRRTFRRLLLSSSLHQGRFSQQSETIHISAATFLHIQRQEIMRHGVRKTIGTSYSITYEVEDGLQSFSTKHTSGTEKLEFGG